LFIINVKDEKRNNHINLFDYESIIVSSNSSLKGLTIGREKITRQNEKLKRRKQYPPRTSLQFLHQNSKTHIQKLKALTNSKTKID